ncbi:MAG: YfhO family protein, partial [Lachnospiraceae bacterium]|nr:YfhO family protein [Lachnospiraceae bacterium]
MSVFYIAVFMPYFVNSLSFLDRGDGLNQYFFSVVKTQEYYKEIISNFLSGNGLSLKMWDKSLGLGEDPLMALNYYGIFNPLMLLSLFFKKEKLGLFFSLLYFIKYILAALSLFFYGYYHKWKLSAIIAADVIYCFCGYCL